MNRHKQITFDRPRTLWDHLASALHNPPLNICSADASIILVGDGWWAQTVGNLRNFNLYAASEFQNTVSSDGIDASGGNFRKKKKKPPWMNWVFYKIGTFISPCPTTMQLKK